MPGTLRPPVATDTFPVLLSTKFSEIHAAQANWNEYHDGTTQRTSLVSSGRRSWKIAKRLTVSEMIDLREFWESHQAAAFYFYNPSETSPPFSRSPIGTIGRYIVRFNSDWEQTAGMVRSDASVELIELASGDDMVAARYPGGTLAAVSPVTLDVVTAFSQEDTYAAFFALNENNPNNIFSGASALFDSSEWTTRTNTFPLDPAAFNVTTFQLYFTIIGTLPGDGTSDLLVYDASITIHYASGVDVVLRPTVATAQNNSGIITNPALAIDGNLATAAQIERSHFAPLADAPLLILKSWQ